MEDPRMDSAAARQEGDSFEAAGVFRGPGTDVRVVLEEIVDEAAFVGIHGVQFDRLAGGLYFGGHFPDAVEEAFNFILPEIFHIEAHAGGVGEFLAEQFVDEVLEVVEAFALPADEGFRFFHADVEGRSGGIFIHFDSHAVTEVAEHDLEDFTGAVGGIHGLGA
jgi:hypothetical protein